MSKKIRPEVGTPEEQDEAHIKKVRILGGIAGLIVSVFFYIAIPLLFKAC